MRISIRTKLLASFAGVIAVVAFFAVSTLLNAMTDRELLAHLALLDDTRSKTQDLQLEVANIWQFLTDASLTRDQEPVAEAQTNWNRAKETLAALGAMDLVPDQAKLTAGIESKLNDFWTTGQAMVVAYGRSKDDGDQVMESFDASGASLLEALDAFRGPLVDLRRQAQSDSAADLEADVEQATWVGTIATGGLLLLAILLARVLASPIVATAKALATLANSQGDLTTRLKPRGRDETADLARSTNEFLSKIQDILIAMARTVASSNVVASRLDERAEQAAGAVSDLAERAESLRAGTESLDLDIGSSGAAVEQILANIDSLARQITNMDRMVNQSGLSIQNMLASITSVSEIAESKVVGVSRLVELSRQGGERVQATNLVIGRVAKNAAAMLTLIDLINDISDRTNLLAMNASIEAAHAGSAGRGFGVVANEIRRLAVDTGSNAQKIGESLRETGEQIQQAERDGKATQEAFVLLEQEVQDFARALNEVNASMSTLSAGGMEVVGSTAELIQTSQVISNSSGEMAQGAKEILEATEHVKLVSRDAKDQMAAVDALARSLRDAVQAVASLSLENRRNNGLLTEQLDRFRLGDTDTDTDRAAQ